jgi:hypothetical protein
VIETSPVQKFEAEEGNLGPLASVVNGQVLLAGSLTKNFPISIYGRYQLRVYAKSNDTNLEANFIVYVNDVLIGVPVIVFPEEASYIVDLGIINPGIHKLTLKPFAAIAPAPLIDKFKIEPIPMQVYEAENCVFSGGAEVSDRGIELKKGAIRQKLSIGVKAKYNIILWAKGSPKGAKLAIYINGQKKGDISIKDEDEYLPYEMPLGILDLGIHEIIVHPLGQPSSLRVDKFKIEAHPRQKFEAEKSSLSNGAYACCGSNINRVDLKGTLIQEFGVGKRRDYYLKLKLTSWSHQENKGKEGAKINVYLNGKKIGTVTIGTRWYEVHEVDLGFLKEGIYELKLEQTGPNDPFPVIESFEIEDGIGPPKCKDISDDSGCRVFSKKQIFMEDFHREYCYEYEFDDAEKDEWLSAFDMDIRVLVCRVGGRYTIVKTGYHGGHNVRIEWRKGLNVDKYRAFYSETIETVYQEMPGEMWTGVALVVGVRCNGVCSEGLRVIAEDYAEYFKEEGYLTIALYDEEATLSRVTRFTKILSVIDTEKKQFVFHFEGHGDEDAWGLGPGEILPYWELNSTNSMRHMRTDTTLILIIEACRSGTFLKRLKNETSHSKYIFLSCGTDNEHCRTTSFCRQGQCEYENWANHLLEEIKDGSSIKDAFDEVKDKVGNQTAQALVEGVDWDEIYLEED